MLNTTSWIQSICKEYNVEVIVSADLVAAVQLMDSYKVEPLGAMKLGGKQKEAFLTTLSP